MAARSRNVHMKDLGMTIAHNVTTSMPKFAGISAEIARSRFVKAIESEYAARLQKDMLARWFMFQSSVRQERDDPVLPARIVPDPNFAEELAKEGYSVSVATALEQEIAAKCARGIGIVRPESPQNIVTAMSGDVYAITCQGTTVTISPRRYELLCARFAGRPDDLAGSIFAVVLRYSYPRSTSFYGTVPPGVFDAFGVTHECFASPLNCRGGAVTYSSPYPDTDVPFGSSGTFGDILPNIGRFTSTPAVFELNPPFLEEIMMACVVFAAEVLKCSAPCSCLIVFPEWLDSPPLTEAKSLPNVQIRTLSRDRHSYIAGEQFAIARQKRVNYVASYVIFAQNDAAVRAERVVLDSVLRAWN